MNDSKKEKTLISGNVSTVEETIRLVKPDDKPSDHMIRNTESCVEKLEKLHEGSKSENIVIRNKNEETNKKNEIKKAETTTDFNAEKESKEPTKAETTKKEATKTEEIMKEERDTERQEEKSDEGGMVEVEKVVSMNNTRDTFLEKPVKRIYESVPCCPKPPREKIIRNQSDIFSLKDISTTLQTSIFSVNGSPSRRVFRKQEPAGHVFQSNQQSLSDKSSCPRIQKITRENYNDEKRPSSSYRNPLTGTGLSSNDEYKSKGNKRKDGNPLLGLGYDSEVTSGASQHRIPPGGFSHKLW